MPKSSKGWIVTTSGERSVKDVAKDLKAKGFSVDQVLDEIGAITGRSTCGGNVPPTTASFSATS